MNISSKSAHPRNSTRLSWAILLILAGLTIILLVGSGTRDPVSLDLLSASTTTTTSDLEGSTNDLSENRQQEMMLSCLKQSLDNLPIGLGRRVSKLNPTKKMLVHAHHYDANTGKWNQDERFSAMPLLESAADKCTVWEVGAYEKADDSRVLLGKYPNCRFHAYEPIPQFFQKLQKLWSSEPRIIPHNYGVGGSDSSFSVDEDALQGQSTYLGDASGGTVKAQIKNFDFAVAHANNQIPTLLHANCEGCEWTMIPQAIESGFLSKVPLIQIGWHNYGEVGLGARVWQYCEIRLELLKTHDLVYSVPFGWERWQKRQ